MEPKRVLLKFGGAAMKDASLSKKLFEAIAKLVAAGKEVTFVHGGGPEIDLMLKRLAIEPKKIDGLRVTDDQTMDVVEMVLAGKVNKNLVSEAQQAGLNAVGLSAIDASIAKVKQKNEQLGNVGSIVSVNINSLKILQSAKLFPIICSIAQDSDGRHMNVNADELAAALAGALKADIFVLVTDVPGLMSKFPDVNSVIPKLSVNEAGKLLDSATISLGMIPKVQACCDALKKGAKASLITDMIYSDLEDYLDKHEQPQGTLIS